MKPEFKKNDNKRNFKNNNRKNYDNSERMWLKKMTDKQIKKLQQQLDQLKQTLTDIDFWVREFLKRTGQVVPNEIRQILRIISEV